MKPNEEFVQKAVVTTDAIAAAGKLNPQQARKFLDYVVDETALANNARVIRVEADEWQADKLGVGRRNAMPATEAQDPGVRRGVTTSQVSLTPAEIIVPFEIGDRFRQINIEGESVEEHIVRLMARASANDIEELYINGNKLGPAVLESEILDGGSATQYVKDSYLALQDGWLKLATGANVRDLENANIGAATFGGMLRSMPTKFRRNRARLRFFMPPDLAQLWQERVSTRGTSGGDEALMSANSPKPYGVPIVEVPLMPFQPRIVEHVVLNGVATSALGNAPVSDVVVTPTTIGKVPLTPYIAGAGNDYIVDAAAGTIRRDAASTIADGATVKVTYSANPQLMLTHADNFIVGIGQDVRIEKARDIFRRVNQYAITLRVGVAIEELTALVLGQNCGTGI